MNLKLSPQSTNSETFTFLPSSQGTPIAINLPSEIQFLKYQRQIQNMRTRFVDCHLAYRLRLSIMHIIANINSSSMNRTTSKSVYETNIYQKDNIFFGELTQQKCRSILTSILNPNNPAQIQYLQNFMSRLSQFDSNSDQLFTYEQFVNFFLEICLPILSLSNLNQETSLRTKGTITMNQFVQILKYQMGLLNCTVTNIQLQELFHLVCEHGDKQISLHNYTLFFKCYFGSYGFAGKNRIIYKLKQNRKLITVKSSQNYHEILIRIGKIVFPQLYTSIIDWDCQKKLGLTEIQIEQFTFRYFSIQIHIRTIKQKEQICYSYREALQIIIRQVFSMKNIKQPGNQTAIMTLEQFTRKLFLIQFKCIKIKPSKYLLQEIYEYYGNKQNGNVTLYNCQSFLRDLGENYLKK